MELQHLISQPGEVIYIAIMNHKIFKAALIGFFNVWTDYIVSTIRINCAKYTKMVWIKPIGSYFTLYSIHLVSTYLDDKIYFTTGFVSPIKYVTTFNN